MPNNIAVGISVDTADLTAKRAILSSELKAASADLRNFADTARTSGMTDELRASMLATGAAVAELKGQIAGLAAEMKVAQPEAVSFGAALKESLAGAAETAQGLKESLMGIGEAMIAFFAVEQIAEFAKGMAENAEQVQHTATILGTTTAQVQELKAMSAGLGIPFESMEAAVLRSSKALTTAREGSKQSSEAFKQLGIDIHTSVTPLDLLKEEITGLANIPDQTTKIGIAFQVFGKNLLPLAPLLGLTKDQMSELNAEFQTYGIANDDAESKGLALADSMNTNHIAMQGLGEVMTSALAPVLTEIVTGLNGMIAGFIQSYNSGGVVKTLMDALVISIKMLVAIITGLGVAFVVAFDVVRGAIASAQATWNLFVDEFDGLSKELEDNVIALGKVIYDSLTNNVLQAANDMRAGWTQMQADAAATAAAIAKDAAAIRTAFMAGGGSEALGAVSAGGAFIGSLFGPDPKTKLGGGGGGGPPPDLAPPKKGKKDNPVKDDDAELQQIKAWQTIADEVAGIQDDMLQTEIAFWSKKAQAATVGSKEWANAVLQLGSATDKQNADQVRAIEDSVNQEIEAHRKALEAQKQFIDEAVKAVQFGVEQEEKLHKDAIEEETKGYKQFVSVVGQTVSGFTSGLLKMAEGAETFQSLMLSIGQNILNSFISKVIDPMVEKWLWGETERLVISTHTTGLLDALGLREMATAIRTDAAKVTANAAGNVAIASSNAATSAAGIGQQLALTMATLKQDAARVFGNVYAWLSGNPVTAPIAPFGAAAAAAAVTAVPFADGTNWIPNDMLAYVHQGERIIPKADNSALMSALGGGGAPWGGGGGGGHTINLGDNHFHGVDGSNTSQFKQMLSDHATHVAGAVASALRNGYQPPYKQPTNRL